MDYFSDNVDYQGQKKAEVLYQVIMIAFAVIGTVYGFYTQRFSDTLIISAAGLVVAGLVCIPSWPFLRKNQLKWLNTIMVPAEEAGGKAPVVDKSNVSRFL
ncbi:signal peptidase complex subunit SPCS1 [Acrasis kona]|uniref:Signal peptidase complex subunit 1 n=1 Tax=Acrasis kona TaxID=1008807 RepID=A0AAW2Z3U0_9EUKA